MDSVTQMRWILFPWPQDPKPQGKNLWPNLGDKCIPGFSN